MGVCRAGRRARGRGTGGDDGREARRAAAPEAGPRSGRPRPRAPPQPLPRAPARPPPRPGRRRVIMVLNAVLIAGVAIIGLSHLHAGPPDPTVAADPPGGPASTLPDPDAVPSGTAAAGQTPVSEPPHASATASPNTGVAHAPKVATRMRSDYATGGSLPYGAGYRET